MYRISDYNAAADAPNRIWLKDKHNLVCYDISKLARRRVETVLDLNRYLVGSCFAPLDTSDYLIELRRYSGERLHFNEKLRDLANHREQAYKVYVHNHLSIIYRFARRSLGPVQYSRVPTDPNKL